MKDNIGFVGNTPEGCWFDLAAAFLHQQGSVSI